MTGFRLIAKSKQTRPVIRGTHAGLPGGTRSGDEQRRSRARPFRERTYRERRSSPAWYVKSGPSCSGHRAQVIELRPKIPKTVAGLRKAFHRLQVSDDARMVRVLTGTSEIAGGVEHSLTSRQRHVSRLSLHRALPKPTSPGSGKGVNDPLTVTGHGTVLVTVSMRPFNRIITRDLSGSRSPPG